MTEGRCQTCKWWDRTEEPSPSDGVCRLFSEKRADADWPDRRAIAYSEGFKLATFGTSFNFGCVQWEPLG